MLRISHYAGITCADPENFLRGGGGVQIPRRGLTEVLYSIQKYIIYNIQVMTMFGCLLSRRLEDLLIL